MGSSATPPWVTELLSRNRKVVRNFSTESYFEGDERRDSLSSGTRTGNGLKNGLTNRVVDPASVGTNKDQMHSKKDRTTTNTTTATEKHSLIREDNRFMDASEDKGKELRNNVMEESILEYGPGIVRKLRSRYQSLALRQFGSRPSLRRSASLENGLDSVDSCTEIVKRESPSPTPFNDEEYQSDKMDNNKRAGMTKSVSMVDANEGPRKAPGPRGRSNNLSERRDRMRRARSVDALHRTKHEEEILEKFKAVVLPKEEIVIIEVSKPRANLSGLGSANNSAAYYLGTTDKPYPTQLFISPKTTAESQQGGIRTRSFVSPEHELPPHDIVRETARIFEKNQENLSINGCKKVGQALRLSKSYSLSGSSSTIAQSPPPPSPTQQQQRGTVMAQGSPSMQQLAEIKRDKSPATGPSFNTTATTKSNAASHAHGPKQVGIIKPTVSHPTSPLNLINGEKVVVTNKTNDTTSSRPPVLSPVLSPSQHAYKTFLQHAQKPPLSPKPIFTSSPKPNVAANNNPKAFPRSTSLGSPSTPPPRTVIIDKRSIAFNNSDKPMLITRTKESPSPPVLSNNNNTSSNSITNGQSINKTKPPVVSPSEQRSLNNSIINGSASNRSITSPKPESDFFRSNSPISPIEDRDTPSPASIKRSQFSGPLRQESNSFSTEDSPPPPPPRTVESLPAQKTGQFNGVGKTSTEPIKKSVKTVVKSTEPSKQIIKDVKQVKAPAPVAQSNTAIKKEEQEESGKSSQLRVHQKQKSTNQGGNAPMVFNFTTRSAVPDYIEDDGLHHGRMTLAGTVTDESVDDVDAPSHHPNHRTVDSKPIKFVGDNVIINGKSSIQKKPKSQKLNISFNESATTTYEYPSEISLLAEDDTSEKDMLGHKGPNVMNTTGSGLGSYTSKLANNDYQLGNYVDPNIKKEDSIKKNKQNNESELIEDYLKPDSETTTWSNEITADILF